MARRATETVVTFSLCCSAASKQGDEGIDNRLREANEMMNPELLRVAFEMATGTSSSTRAVAESAAGST